MYLLPSDAIEGWWPMVSPLISKAWATTQIGALLSLDDVRDKLEAGTYYCFISGDKSYAGVFSIAQSPRCRYLKFFLSGGQEPEGGWDSVDAFLREAAEAFGCSRIYLEGRVGWRRKVEPLGYTVDSLLMTKEVTI